MPNVILQNAVMPRVVAWLCKTCILSDFADNKNKILFFFSNPLWKLPKDQSGLYYKSFRIVIYDRNDSTIVVPVLSNYNRRL